jgi:transmembrane sensor
LDSEALERAATRLLRAQDDAADFDPSADARPVAPNADAAAAHAIADAWQTVGDLASTPELMAMRRAALAHASRTAEARWRRPIGRHAAGWSLVAAMLLVVVLGGLSAFLLTKPPAARLYETGRGERIVVTLADQSKVVLDENAKLSVRYSRRARDLQLLEGQAEFDVAKDVGRPFSVTAGDRRVVATGTLFNVDLLEQQLIVTLMKGRVYVDQPAAPPGEGGVIGLMPSERLVVARENGVATKSKVDTLDVEAWKFGKLVFDAEPLELAVSRVNRYSPRKITLSAAERGEETISGVFNIGDADAFAEAVSAQLRLRVERRANGIALLAR